MIDLPEDSHGQRKRLHFIQHLIGEIRPRRILDVGCGTGVTLTSPIAAAFPEIEVVGVDTDCISIAWANSHPHPDNVVFCSPAALPSGSRYDFVIACEVLEHVDEPLDFLHLLRSRLSQHGTMVLSIPNGYGPFEILSFIAVLLHGPALKRLYGRLRQRISPRAACSGPEPAKATLAVSPHVNFFRLPCLRALLAASGLCIAHYKPTTFLGGPGVDTLLRALNALEWNARICDRLPYWCASDWILVLRPSEPAGSGEWHRGAIARFRRALNLRRWGIAEKAPADRLAESEG